MLHIHRYSESNVTLHSVKDEDGEVMGLLIVQHCTKCKHRREDFIPKRNIQLFLPAILDQIAEE